MLIYLLHLGSVLGPWLYVAAGVLVFGESALLLGMVLPGETALLVAGYFSQHGVLSLAVMMAVGVAAAIAGDTVGFLVGRRYGRRLRYSAMGRRVGPARWEWVDRFLARHGGSAILLARLTAVLRAVTPSVAGMSSLPLRRFMAWNALGGTIWATGAVALGWLFSTALTQVGQYLAWAPLVLLAVTALVAAAIHMTLSHQRPRAGIPSHGRSRQSAG